ncbi:MAG: hypothetical protein M1830_009212 [Pleopsidium flavum]|nr:MAG: hypothetical protein M1830_009212 [Pleopsidium flavum]
MALRTATFSVNTTHSAAPSPIPTSVSESTKAGGNTMRGAGSDDAGSRAPSSFSMRVRESSGQTGEAGVAGSSAKPKATPLSRTSSTHVAPSNRRDVVSSLRNPKSQQGPDWNIPNHEVQTEPQPGIKPAASGTQHSEQAAASPSAKSDSSSSSSSSESESREQKSKSQTFKRRPRFSSTKAPAQQFEDGEDDDGDDEESPAFLPFSNPVPPPDAHDPSATLRIHAPSKSTQHQAPTNEPIKYQRSQTTHSSASSGSSAAAAGTQVDGGQSQRPLGPLSPRRAAELAALSPRRRALAKEGSDGTPSMGSSFSDLDDASVTQSALEEALLSNMQHGGVASRMSTISQALRSRYL